jgi:hypothetical protein
MTDADHVPKARSCPTCGYDLRGHTPNDSDESILCPECGNPAPPPTERRIVEPGAFWHVALAISFGLPLVLTALEAADQMVIHACGAAYWAPGWLLPTILLGGVGMLACLCHAWKGTRHRERLELFGVLMVALYILAILFMDGWIDWTPYRN